MLLVVRRGIGWFGLTRRRVHPSTSHTYDFRVTLVFDQSTPSMVLPLEKYSDTRTPKTRHGCSSSRTGFSEGVAWGGGGGGRSAGAQVRGVRTPNFRNNDLANDLRMIRRPVDGINSSNRATNKNYTLKKCGSLRMTQNKESRNKKLCSLPTPK